MSTTHGESPSVSPDIHGKVLFSDGRVPSRKYGHKNSLDGRSTSWMRVSGEEWVD